MNYDNFLNKQYTFFTEAQIREGLQQDDIIELITMENGKIASLLRLEEEQSINENRESAVDRFLNDKSLKIANVIRDLKTLDKK